MQGGCLHCHSSINTPNESYSNCLLNLTAFTLQYILNYITSLMLSQYARNNFNASSDSLFLNLLIFSNDRKSPQSLSTLGG